MKIRTMTLCAVAVMATLFAMAASAQTTTVTLGVQGTGNIYPFNYSPGAGRFQSAYAANELNVPAGFMVTEVRVYGSGVAAPTYGGFRLRLAHTTLAPLSLQGNFDSNADAGPLVEVIGPTNITPTQNGNWYIFPLTTPFIYNGVDGLLVDWSYTSRSGTGWTISSSSGRTRVYNNSNDQVNGTTANSGNYGIEFDFLPGNGTILSSGNLTGFVKAGDTNAEAGTFKLDAYQDPQSISSVTLSYTGNVAPTEITNISLWEDNNSDGILDGGDTQLGSTAAVLTGSKATFTGAPLLAMAADTSTQLLVTCDVGSGAVGRELVTFVLESASDFVVSPGPDNTSYPVSGGVTEVVEYNTSYPYFHDFDADTINPNMVILSDPGTYPTATAAGTVPSSASAGASGTMGTAAAYGSVSPVEGSHMLVGSYNSPEAVTALDMRFDLSGFNAASTSSEVRLTFGWYDGGLETPTGDDFNYVFLSDDGGQTWFTAAYDFNESKNSGNWEKAEVNLSGAFDSNGRSFSSEVVVRIQTGGTSTAQATLIDYAEVREVFQGLEVKADPPLSPGYYYLSPRDDMVVLPMSLIPQVNHQSVSSITLTNAGTMPDTHITEVKLWLDVDYNGLVNAGDVLLGNQTYSSGTATFVGFNLPVNLGTTRDFVVTYSFVQVPSGSVGCEIAASSDVVNAPDPVYAYSGSFPEGGVIGTVATPTATLPYLENFDTPPSNNIAATTWAGSYPTAAASGGGVSFAPSPNDAELGWWANRNGIDPHNGSAGLGSFEFLRGQAAAAMDFMFDLSAYSAASDEIVFRFAWVDNGLDAPSAEFDHVFLSLDGGQSWVTSLLFLDPDGTANIWKMESINLSEALLNLGEDFTNSMIIRVQFADNAGFAMIDDVEMFAVGPTAPEIGSPFATGGGVAVGYPEIIYYKMNEGAGTTTFNDAVPGEGYQFGDLAAGSNQPQWVTPGYLGDAHLNFNNATGNGIDTGHTTGLASNVDWTIETWYRMASTSAGYIFCFQSNSFRFYQTGGTMYLYSSGVSPNPSWSAGPVNVWQHVAIVNDANAGTVTVYKDGAPVSTFTGNATGTGLFVVGALSLSSTNFKGELDEFRVWDGARTAQEIQAGYQDELASYPSMEFTGTKPNYAASIEQGGNLDFTIGASDVNAGDTITFTISQTGGTLTAADAGFDQVFTGGVYNDPNPGSPAPHTISLSGVADQLGTIQFTILAQDGSGLTDTVTIDVTIDPASTPLVRAVPTELASMNSYGINQPSMSEKTIIQGYGLTGDLTITAPSQFEVSQTAGVGFSNQVVLTPVNGNVPRTDIFVRYNPSVTGSHAGEVVASGPGVSIDAKIKVDGYILPEIPPILQRPTSASNGLEVLASNNENASTGPGFPLSTDSHDMRMQSVYLVPELTSAGLAGGSPITEIQLRVTEEPGREIENFRIRMQHTSAGTVTALSTSGFTDVYGPSTISEGQFAEGEWYSFKLSTPFIWNGVDNLIVDFSMDGTAASQGGGIFMRDTGGNRSRSGYDNSGSSFPFNGIDNQTQHAAVPAIRISQGLSIGGSQPNYTALAVLGDDLDIQFSATDANTQEILTFTISEAGGTLTASQAGFDQTFSGGIYADPTPGKSPRSLSLTGIAQAVGSLNLQVQVHDGVFNTTINVALEIVVPPSLTVTGTPLPVFVAPVTGGPSQEQSIEVGGTDLLSDVSITVPPEFEVTLTSGSNYGSSVTLSPSGTTLAQTAVFFRYNPAAGNTTAAGQMVISTDRVVSVKELLFGAVGPDPAITTLDTPVPTLFAPAIGTPGEPERFRVLVANPIGPVMVTAPDDFQVSLSENSGYGSSVAVQPSAGQTTQLAMVVFVRYSPQGPAGSTSANLTVAASSASTLDVPVEGVIGTPSVDDGSGGSSSDSSSGCSTGISDFSKWSLLLGALALLMLATRLRRARS